MQTTRYEKRRNSEMAMDMIAGVDKTPIGPHRRQAATGGRRRVPDVVLHTNFSILLPT